MKSFMMVMAPAFLLCGPADIAFAFDRCTAEFVDSQELRSQIIRRATVGGSVKYRNLVDEIRLIINASDDTMLPFAVQTGASRAIVFPSDFPPVLCKIALAMFLAIEGIQEDAFQRAATSAASCFDEGGNQSRCLTRFANELESIYGAAYSELSDQAVGVSMNIYISTLYQIAMHEYAHHFLDHFDRIEANRVSRIDAEFEADYFAIMNGVQYGEPTSAMYYFFSAIADIEYYTDTLVTPKYESGACRTKNVENVTAITSIAPLIVLDVAYGGRYRLGSLSSSDIERYGDEVFRSGVPALIEGSCGRIAEAMLADAFLELKSLYYRIATDGEFLLGEGSGPDPDRTNALLRDLFQMARSFEYMNGIAASSASLILRKRGLEGRDLAPFVGSMDSLLETSEVNENLLSGDYGRLLQAQGLSLIQERVDLPAQARLDQAFAALERAVFFNPAQSEAWMNLALIDFKRGNCVTAARFARKSLQTISPEEDREPTEFFARLVQQFSEDPEKCRAEAAKYQFP